MIFFERPASGGLFLLFSFMKKVFIIIFLLNFSIPNLYTQVKLTILGVAQDGGVPHAGCMKECCSLHLKNETGFNVVSLGLTDEAINQNWLFEATPDITKQLDILVGNDIKQLTGIFLSHAHIGHYTGLMYLGKEVMGTKGIQVNSMPIMSDFLRENGPWEQLVKLKNITINEIYNKTKQKLNSRISVKPIIVPHRDEYTETVGYLIEGPNKRALFIPDIDKWSKWDEDINEYIKKVDFAFLDATFFNGEELNTRDITEIPHPFVIESLEKFSELSVNNNKKKIYFIHFNHTNKLLIKDSEEYKQVIEAGYNISAEGMEFEL